MNLNQIVHELTYWFDYGMHMVLNHPLVSAAAVLGAFLLYQTVGAIKLILSLGLAVLTAIILRILMF
jgi:hypothetical protein